MNEKEYLNSAEKLLYTDLRELLGGKTKLPDEVYLRKSGGDIPPPSLPNVNGEGGDGNSLPSLRSESVNELLSTPPKWLVRWGITLFFSILLVLLATAHFVKYPDIIKAQTKVVASTNPKPIVVRKAGRLQRLFVADGQEVRANQPVAYMESIASKEEVDKLELIVNELITKANEKNFEAIYAFSMPYFFELGELQKSYQNFQDNFARSKALRSSGAVSQKKQALNNDRGLIENMKQNARNQLGLVEEEMQKANEDYLRQKRLSEKGYVSLQDVRNAENVYLAKKQAYQQAKSSLQSQDMTINQKKQELIEIDKQVFEQQTSLVQSLLTLKSDIASWKYEYILSAPMSGKVSFIASLQENQVVQSGQELFYVMSDDSHFVGEMAIGQYNFGKLKTGQDVLLKFPSFPYQEYGILHGKVSSISTLPKDTAYFVHVELPIKLTTDMNKNLSIKNGMTASAEVITEDLSLLDRFFMEIRKTVKSK